MRSLITRCELDKTGGVKLPDILLGLCNVEAGDAIEMNLDGDIVVMKKYPSSYIFCGSESDLREYMDKYYCCDCANELKKI
jgi:transcriptional pleiotropic regulator of transition state genes